jgi:hypothetical protein
MLIHPWLEVGTSILLHASAGEGKSCLMMHVGIRLAGGRLPVFFSNSDDPSECRWPVMRPARVLYVDGEMSAESFQRRLARFDRIPSTFLVLNKDEARRRESGLLGNLYEREHRARLDAYIEACKAEVIILDNIFHLFEVSLEKELEKWTELNRTWVYDHKSAGRSLIFVHHEPKASPGSSFGTVGREIGVDVRIGLGTIKSQPTDGSTTRQVNIFKGRELDGHQKTSFIARLRLDAERNRYIWTGEDVPEGQGKPGRPKSAEAEAKRQRIYELHAEGMTQGEIAEAVGCSRQHVNDVISQARKDKPGCN